MGGTKRKGASPKSSPKSTHQKQNTDPDDAELKARYASTLLQAKNMFMENRTQKLPADMRRWNRNTPFRLRPALRRSVDDFNSRADSRPSLLQRNTKEGNQATLRLWGGAESTSADCTRPSQGGDGGRGGHADRWRDCESAHADGPRRRRPRRARCPLSPGSLWLKHSLALFWRLFCCAREGNFSPADRCRRPLCHCVQAAKTSRPHGVLQPEKGSFQKMLRDSTWSFTS